ncbi:hypothetical protein EON63_10590 [archaeon]|nr:MAG: hypothetical protein EON63_10590 [archaeon]
MLTSDLSSCRIEVIIWTTICWSCSKLLQEAFSSPLRLLSLWMRLWSSHNPTLKYIAMCMCLCWLAV